MEDADIQLLQRDLANCTDPVRRANLQALLDRALKGQAKLRSKMDELALLSTHVLAEVMAGMRTPEVLPLKKDPDDAQLTDEERARRRRLKEADCLVALLRALYEEKEKGRR